VPVSRRGRDSITNRVRRGCRPAGVVFDPAAIDVETPTEDDEIGHLIGRQNRLLIPGDHVLDAREGGGLVHRTFAQPRSA
jgi:hypothetical protein